jgi:hypothetical protein
VLFAPAAPTLIGPTRAAAVTGAPATPPRSRGPPRQALTAAQLG